MVTRTTSARSFTIRHLLHPIAPDHEDAMPTLVSASTELDPRVVDFVSPRSGNYQHNPQWGLLVDQLWVR